MSERLLAKALALTIVESISSVDLPVFLINSLEHTLSELNYYKLSNLHDNINEYITYLQWVAQRYVQYCLDLINERSDKHSSPNTHHLITDSLSAALKKQWVALTLSKTDSATLQSVFSVSCVLTLKEYVHRRILQKFLLKQKSMSTLSH